MRRIDVGGTRTTPTANSVFAWNYEDDFFAGYDHGKQAGTMSVADHNMVPGKKFFTWGNGPAAACGTTLTDSDGPYIELMVGPTPTTSPTIAGCNPTKSGRSR